VKGTHRSELQAWWWSTFFARSTHELTPTSHLQNDGATSTSADAVSNSMLLKLKRGGRKGNRKGTEADVH